MAPAINPHLYVPVDAAAHLASIKTLEDVAVLVVDVQDKFCNPTMPRGTAESKKVADRIVSILPKFRKAAVSVYMIHTDEPDFYKGVRAEGDIPVQKSANDAFEKTDLDDRLNAQKKKHLLVCGFNLSACVYDTVMGALTHEEYSVYLMQDLSGNGLRSTGKPMDNPVRMTELMKYEGAKIVKSSDVLRHFKKISAKQHTRKKPCPKKHPSPLLSSPMQKG